MRKTPIQIDCDIPAGKLLLEGIDGDDVSIAPDLRDTEGHWFYWHFRVRGAAGRTLRFHLTRSPALTSRGAAVSLDGGWSWRWLGREDPESESFVYSFPADALDVRFSMGMPYTRRNFGAFIDRWGQQRELSVSTLCRSRAGRDVPLLCLNAEQDPPARRVLITARHHCCEMMASYAMEGLLAAAAAHDKTGEWLSGNVQIFAVPFVDSDGVEAGDQGKNRRPYDHNRDYAGDSIYPETAAIRERFGASCDDGPDVTIDLHCPYIRGGKHNEHIYIVGSPSPGIWSEQQRFARVLESVHRGPLPYDPALSLPFGTDWNVEKAFATGRSCSRWACQLPKVQLATGFEIPYASAGGAEVNAATARAFGADLARALAAYLRPKTRAL